MFNVQVDYPSATEEVEILKRTTAKYVGDLKAVLTGAEISHLQEIVRRVPVAEHVYQYATRLVRNTRPKEKSLGGRSNGEDDKRQVYDFIRDYVSWGAGPRACQYLIL